MKMRTKSFTSFGGMEYDLRRYQDKIFTRKFILTWITIFKYVIEPQAVAMTILLSQIIEIYEPM